MKHKKFCHAPLLMGLKENHPDDFKNYLRMDDKTFQWLIDLTKYCLIKQDSRMRKLITPKKGLTAALRFLATGRCYEDLKFSHYCGSNIGMFNTRNTLYNFWRTQESIQEDNLLWAVNLIQELFCEQFYSDFSYLQYKVYVI